MSRWAQEHLLEKFCKENSIVHKLIPPGEKELQGLVERAHRQDDQKLFSRICPEHLNEFNQHLRVYQDERNRKRRFKKLDWKTPDEWLENYVVVNLTLMLILKDKDVRNPKNAVTIRKLAA